MVNGSILRSPDQELDPLQEDMDWLTVRTPYSDNVHLPHRHHQGTWGAHRLSRNTVRRTLDDIQDSRQSDDVSIGNKVISLWHLGTVNTEDEMILTPLIILWLCPRLATYWPRGFKKDWLPWAIKLGSSTQTTILTIWQDMSYTEGIQPILPSASQCPSRPAHQIISIN